MEIQYLPLINMAKPLQRISIWKAIAIISIILNILFLLITSIRLSENVTIFYWQKFDNYFFYLRCLTFLIIPIAIWFSSMNKAYVWMNVMAVIGSCFILGFVNYTSLFIVNIIDHIGTVQFDGEVFQLASVAKYDDETIYYLGECEPHGFICEFHQIYRLYLFGVEPTSDIELVDNGKMLVVKLDAEPAYLFDGTKVTCNDTDYGYCVTN